MRKIFTKTTLLLLSVVLFSFFHRNQAYAQTNPGGEERIIKFESSIFIRKDSSLLVTEDITVNATGNKIKRGIFRDFPTIYGNWFKATTKGFRIISVFKNNIPEPYRLEKQINGVRVYIGDNNIYIPSDIYQYKIIYETTNQLGFFKDYDELYWNVTGNGWEFPIEEAQVTVTLPENISPDSLVTVGYIGPQGSKEQSNDFFQTTLNNSTIINGKMSRPLGVKEGYTVAIHWPRGIVNEPTLTDRLISFFDIQTAAGVLLSITILIVYLTIWYKVGRDNKFVGPTVVQLTPPKDITPAEMRTIHNMGNYDDACLTTAMVSLAAQGFLKIKKINNMYSLIRTDKNPDTLINEEKMIYTGIFPQISNVPGGQFLVVPQLKQAVERDNVILSDTSSKSPIVQNLSGFINAQVGNIANMFSAPIDEPNAFVIRPSNWQILATVKNDVEEYFNKIKKNLVISNHSYLFIAVFIFILFLAAQVYNAVVSQNITNIFFMFFAGFWNAVVSVFVGACFQLWSAVIVKKQYINVFMAIFLSVFLIPFVGVGIFTGSMAFGLIGIVGLVLSLIMIKVFYAVLPRRTIEARKIQNVIDGFVIFLKSQNRHITGVKMDLPAKFSMYERYLPYAIALGVEPEWNAQFKDTFTQMLSAGMPVVPAWYVGSDLGSKHDFSVNGFSDSLTSSISSSSGNPSLSSGSSGGGSSGGGGGGGGGGGW